MRTKALYKLVFTALFAALTCIATMMIQIPSPTGGYKNAGDALVFLSGWLLGPWLGGLAGGVGSALADLLSGYAYYVPGTFLIKGLEGVVCALLFRLFCKLLQSKKKHPESPDAGTDSFGYGLGFRLLFRFLSALAGCIIMVGGYFFYAALLLGKGYEAALSSLPGNVVQSVLGLLLAMVLMEALLIHPSLRKTLMRDLEPQEPDKGQKQPPDPQKSSKE